MARIIKSLKIILHFFTIIAISYFLVTKQKKVIIIKKIDRFLPDIKHLLIWTSVPGITREGQVHFIQSKCRKINCYLTKNRSLLGDIRLFDGVLFSLKDVSKNQQELPKIRAAHQRYIFAANDSSDNFPVCSPYYENFFNWTWTYRTDSVIHYKFFSIFHVDHDGPLDNYQWIKEVKSIDETFKSQLSSKTKAAAIFLDKCESRSKREVFLNRLIEELARYNLSVDVYGNCGNKQCRRKSMNSCYWKLRKIYHFYLAMEDSFAEDFVTESIVYGYKYNAVPIVYGKANYEKFLPPHSYLDALKLGEEKLAEVMSSLIKNKERYYEFFSWRNHYNIKATQPLDACTLCDTLNNPAWLNYRGYYDEFRKWWNPKYEERCAFYSKYFTL